MHINKSQGVSAGVALLALTIPPFITGAVVGERVGSQVIAPQICPPLTQDEHRTFHEIIDLYYKLEMDWDKDPEYLQLKEKSLNNTAAPLFIGMGGAFIGGFGTLGGTVLGLYLLSRDKKKKDSSEKNAENPRPAGLPFRLEEKREEDWHKENFDRAHNQMLRGIRTAMEDRKERPLFDGWF